MFAVPRAKPEPHLKGKIELPSMLSWLAFGNAKAEVRGLDAFSPQDRPPTWLTFVSFHNMVVLGLWFTFILALSSLQLWRGKLWTSRTILRALVWTIPFPLFACQLGWMAAEVGRQPWAVYHVFRTADAHSQKQSATAMHATAATSRDTITAGPALSWAVIPIVTKIPAPTMPPRPSAVRDAELRTRGIVLSLENAPSSKPLRANTRRRRLCRFTIFAGSLSTDHGRLVRGDTLLRPLLPSGAHLRGLRTKIVHSRIDLLRGAGIIGVAH